MFNYHCFNSEDRPHCNQCSKDGQVLANEKAAYICPCNGEALKLLGEIGGSAAVKTPTRTMFNLSERKQRNRKHFKNDVLPTIADPDAKNHHVKKLGYKS